jgi:hypothetical protein
MPTIKEYYGITGPVPFVDVEISRDNQLYVDPHAIRRRQRLEPFARDAVTCIDTFLHEVTQSIIDATPASHARGHQLLQQFTEPWETRLGMAKGGFHGHGGGDVVGTWIWEVLNGDAEAVVQIGALRHIEHLPLFVEGVDRDITSDITTRIIFSVLADFTESMLQAYPQLQAGRHKTRTFGKQVWDPVGQSWRIRKVTLPIADGKALLLVPNGWARRHLLMSARRFYGTTVLSYAQLELAVIDSNGKLLTTPKKILRKRTDLREGRATNLRLTLQAIENEEDLINAFEAFVALRENPDSSSNAA